ncbi:hypothetical protein AN1V17_23810 [Vallitalea sediminicola]
MSIAVVGSKFKNEIEELGKLGCDIRPLPSGQKQKLYLLNEPQASYLITLLENNDIVRKFKLELVKQFYRMRTALMERQTTEWLQTRQKGKLVRRKETDSLAQLKAYAEEQREGKPYKQIYTNYTKLVNNAVGINTGERNIATFKQLQIVSLLEDMVQHTVLEEMQKGVFFKEIYKKCKAKVNTFVSLMYLDTDVKQLNSVS